MHRDQAPQGEGARRQSVKNDEKTTIAEALYSVDISAFLVPDIAY